MTTRIGMEATLQLTLQGPLLIHANEMGPWGVDVIAMRDAQGHLIIPGDQIQGKVREALEALDKEYGGLRRSAELEHLVNRDEPDERDEDVAARDKRIDAFRESQHKNLEADPKRYPIQFSDFRSLAAYGPPGWDTLTQIKMNPDTGATESGMLRVLDAPLRPGQWATFMGTVRYLGDSSTNVKDQLERILRAFEWIPSFGSQKSVGFGRLRKVTCIAQAITSFEQPGIVTFRGHPIHSENESVEMPTEFLVDFTFQDPLCIPEGVVNGNIFETRREIPGEALRGAVAGLLQRITLGHAEGTHQPENGPTENLINADNTEHEHPYSDLEKCFSRIRVTMARPVPAQSEPDWPAVIPKSLIIDQKTSPAILYDVALADEKQLAKHSSDTAPAFAPDWKDRDWSRVNAHFQIMIPEEELRVRTAIDSSHRRAKQGQLFAYRTLCPQGIAWRARVTFDRRLRGSSDDVPSADQTEAALSQFVSLLNSGWLSVSKTKARGRGNVVALRPLPRRIEPITLGKDRVFVIMLRGPALMIDPRQCIDQHGGLNSLEDIDELYGQYWTEISGGLLEEIPERRFKQDRLIGGFQARKYRYSTDVKNDLCKVPKEERKEKAESFPYNPTLVVDSGSVFVLRIDSQKRARGTDADLPGKTPLEKASRLVAEWNAHGLPIPAWAAKAYGDTYHTNIFIPQNGFGEIDVNLPCHLHHTHDNPVARFPDDREI